MNQDAESYGSNGFNAGQFNGPSGKCVLNAMSRMDSIKADRPGGVSHGFLRATEFPASLNGSSSGNVQYFAGTREVPARAAFVARKQHERHLLRLGP
jgi:hypothetical protein